MNKIAMSLIGATFLAAFGSASASDVLYTVNGSPAGGQDLASNPISSTFSGPAALRAGICSLSCTLSVTGTLTDTGSDVLLTITDADSSGNIACNSVGFSGFDWTGSVPHSTLPSAPGSTAPISFTVGTVRVSSICGSCTGTVNAQYNPGNPSTFTFTGITPGTGSCSVNGTVTDGNAYDIWHP